MADPYVGEIRIFAPTFPPVGWALCNGALYAISNYESLFNLIGPTYGGDGQSTFAVPDLRGRAPMHQGASPPIGVYHVLAEKGGVENVTLTSNQVGAHSHNVPVSLQGGDKDVPGSTTILSSENAGPATNGVFAYAPAAGSFTSMNAATVGSSGGNQPHENMQPSLCLNFIIAMDGIYPTQS